MGEGYEVNLLSNVHAVDSKSSVSKEFPGLKRKQARENRKRRGGCNSRSEITRVSSLHGGYEKETAENEQESTIDITI
jgi:hypothetical protein